jgi:hypothetical protein
MAYHQLIDFAGVVFQSTAILSEYKGTRLLWDARYLLWRDEQKY